MSFVLYMVFGMLEIYALFALMFRTFRLPYFEYLKEISIISVTVCFVSYIIRVYLEVNMLIDIATHIILYILFFRFLIKVKVWRALIISLVYIGYAVINIIVFYSLTTLNLLSSESIVTNPNGVQAYVIQSTTIAIAFTISFVLYKLGYGFSFIIRPPHDFFLKTTMKKSDITIIAAVSSLFIVFFLTVYLISSHKIYISIPLIIASYTVIVYLAYRRDMTA